MNEPTVARESVPRAERRRQRLHVAGGAALVVAVAVLAVVVLRRNPADRGEAAPVLDERLRAAIEEADRLDPRWRFAELEEDRAPVPADENAAPLVLAAATLIPDPWNGLPPATVRERLRQGMLDESPRADFEPAGATVFAARQLARFQRGRYAVDWNRADPLVTPLPHLRKLNAVVDLLTLDAEVRAHEGDVVGALVSVRAALVAARSIGDEPMLESQMSRPGWNALAVQALEEALRRGQAGEGELLGVQSALEEEVAESLALRSARAERAGLHGLLTALEKGELTLAALSPLIGRGELGGRTEAVRLILVNDKLRRPESLQAIHAWLLDYTTKFVEIAQMPPAEQAPRLQELADTAPLAPPGTMPLLAGVPIREIVETFRKSQALLRCAATGIAVERYRLTNGRWPDDLGALVPHYLAKVPADPFDGNPLRYEREKDGAAVSSAGPGPHGSFRLWNVEARLKAPKK